MDTHMFRSIGNKSRLVDRVVNEIQKRIIDGRLEPGMRLPPERELAEQIGVSRTVIREAVHILVTKGLLTTKHGVGTIVRRISSDNVTESLHWLLRSNGVSLDDLHHVRSILEVENVRLAAANCGEAEIAELRQILSDMAAVTGDAEAFASKDAEFHSALSRMAHNPLLVVLLDSIGDLMREVRLTVSKYPDLFARVMPDHYRILERVAAGDADGASQAMVAHLGRAREIQKLFEENQRLAGEPHLPAEET